MILMKTSRLVTKISYGDYIAFRGTKSLEMLDEKIKENEIFTSFPKVKLCILLKIQQQFDREE